MKIVYFIDHLRPDGTQRVLTQLLKGLGERGHQQAVVCLNDSWDGEVMDKLRAVDCEVRMIGKIALASGVGLVSTWSWLKQERFDVAVTMLFAADVIGRLLARLAAVPRIVTSLRARNINYKGWQLRLVKYTMRWADLVVINSQGVKDFAIQKEGADPYQIKIIPNGISINGIDYLAARQKLIEDLKIKCGGILIGSAGRLTYQKGFDILIQAVSLLPGFEGHLLIMGNGEQEAALRELATASGLDGRVHFLGYRKDILSLLGGLDLYVQPSRFEGMPNALMEAMAAGCPAVASAVDGNLELVEDGVSGLLFPCEDPEALKTALLTVINDRDKATMYSHCARTHLATNYSLSEMILAWERVLTGSFVVN